MKENLKIEITKPELMDALTPTVEEILYQLEYQLKYHNSKGLDVYNLTISGQVNVETCSEIRKNYEEAGWVQVRCNSNNGFINLTLWRIKPPKANKIVRLIEILGIKMGLWGNLQYK